MGSQEERQFLRVVRHCRRLVLLAHLQSAEALLGLLAVSPGA